VLCTPDKEAEARRAGADFVGLEEFVTKIEGGWVDVDVIIATPYVMPKIGKLGKVLGPRNLMPNPKTGTVTNDVGKAVNEVKAGKIDFKVDKQGIIRYKHVMEEARHLLDAEEIFNTVKTIVSAAQ
jgi:large subunit ribosomal protein L1